jgi:transposase-like protein
MRRVISSDARDDSHNNRMSSLLLMQACSQHAINAHCERKAPMKAKHPGGRPTSYRPEFCQRVVALMAEGRSLEGCAALLGVHPDSLYEWQKVHPEFSEAVRAGRAAATTFWENRLLDVANGGSGNAQAIQWALRNRSRAASGWHHDSQKFEHSGPDGAPVAIEASASSGRLNIEQMSWEDREALKGILLRAKAAAEGQAKIGHSED